MKKILYKLTKKYWSILSLEHAKKNKFIVQNGLFKNLKINKEISWGKADIASKVYGLYENKIQKILAQIKKPILIDIGAADGFFAIGSLHSKISKHCYAFEQSNLGRSALSKTAELNKVSENITIKGGVNSQNFLSLLPQDIDFSKAIVLCDIEGEEYSFFTDNILKKLEKSHIIIEIHQTRNKNNEIKLMKRIKSKFNVTIITGSENDYSRLPEIQLLNDIDRNLIACEGRSYIGKWWYLKPL
jgi:hypothetical protein